MESDVTDISSNSQGDAKGLDGAIEVLVIQSVLIVPDSWTWVSHFVTHEPDAIVTRVRLILIYYGARRGPSHDGRLRPDCGGNRRKCEVSCTAHAELAVGDVVIHVAFAWMRLAPGVFMRTNVRRFGKIGGTLVEVCV